jgi:hypothetical protein
MRLRARTVALIAAMLIAVAPIALVDAPARASTKAEMNIADQPGYVPSPAEEQVAPEYLPQPVFFRTSEAPGTIVIHTDERFLYLVQGGGRAIRYGIYKVREICVHLLTEKTGLFGLLDEESAAYRRLAEDGNGKKDDGHELCRVFTLETAAAIGRLAARETEDTAAGDE